MMKIVSTMKTPETTYLKHIECHSREACASAKSSSGGKVEPKDAKGTAKVELDTGETESLPKHTWTTANN